MADKNNAVLIKNIKLNGLIYLVYINKYKEKDMKNILNYSIAAFCSANFLPILLIGVIFAPSNLAAQFDLNPEFQVSVEEDGNPLLYPWAGGLNAPQFSQFDLNNDGLEDLFVFERVTNKVMVFTNLNAGVPNYEFNPNIAAQFPVLRSWALIRDYNCDGVADIFTGRKHNGKEGIALYSGSYSGSTLNFSSCELGRRCYYARFYYGDSGDGITTGTTYISEIRWSAYWNYCSFKVVGYPFASGKLGGGCYDACFGNCYCCDRITTHTTDISEIRWSIDRNDCPVKFIRHPFASRKLGR